ncbi:MAG: AAA family ATPase [Acidobacteriota bacterium]
MIESVQFRNFKALRNTTLPLGRFTLIVGPNGSGKSTALQALRAAVDFVRRRAHVLSSGDDLDFHTKVTAGLELDDSTTVEVVLQFGEPWEGFTAQTMWRANSDTSLIIQPDDKPWGALYRSLNPIRIYSFDAGAMSVGTLLEPRMTLDSNGGNLAVVLDQLHNRETERFEQLNDEMARWLPEFDRILFDTPGSGRRGLLLRTREGHFQIPATELSQGTLLALAILTLTYIPNPPSIVCLEEPDRGIHPRLLRDVRDALYRLSYPENYGEKRDPVQVIATTHSPYLLDLFKDHPEEVVIANKVDQDVCFERLSDRADIDEILGETQLGDAWYSGVLGGVPSHP